MKLLVWNVHVKKPDGTLQPVLYEKAKWKLIQAITSTEVLLVHIEHGFGVTVMPLAAVAQIEEQP